MKKKVIIIVVAIVLVAAIAVAGVLCLSPSEEPKKVSLFTCDTTAEMVQYANERNIPLEIKENILHLYNVEFAGQVGYCVAEYQSEALRQMVYYITIENNDQLSSVMESVKTTFLAEYGLEGEYEYYPLESNVDTSTEKDFLEQKASKELFVFGEDATWNISWLVTEDGVSGKISKVVK